MDWIIVGQFGRPHGIKGFITTYSFTEHVENILDYISHWHINARGTWEPIKILETQVTHKHILVKIEGCQEREEIAALTNMSIAIPYQELPQLQPGEYYWHDLIGMSVVTREGHFLGEVVEMLPTGSHDVLVINGSKRTLIPYLPGLYVLEVLQEQGKIIVDWDTDF